MNLIGLFELDAFYRRISDGLGVYSCDFNFQAVIPPIQVGVATLTVPSVLVEVYTDGGYYIDFGYPRGADFTRSFKIEVAIFTGGGGFYFGSRALAAVNILRLEEQKGDFLPAPVNHPYLKEFRAVSAGVKFRGGVGRSFDAGIMKAEAVLAFYGSMEGAVACRGGSSRPSLWAVGGTIGILFTITAEVDFVVLKASAQLLAYAETGFIFRKVLALKVGGGDVFYHVTLPVTFFVEVGLHVHLEVWAKIGCVQVKIFEFEYRGSWRMEFEAGGFSYEKADGGSSFFLHGSRESILTSSAGWSEKFQVWQGKRDINLLATLMPCVANRNDLAQPPDDKPYQPSMVAQLVSIPGPTGGFALLAEFMVRWALEVTGENVMISHEWLKARRLVFREDAPWTGAMARAVLENLKQHFDLKLSALKPDKNINSYVGLPLWPEVSWGFVRPDAKGGLLLVSSRELMLPIGRGLPNKTSAAVDLQSQSGCTQDNLFVDYLRALTSSFLDEIDRRFTYLAEDDKNVVQGTLERPWSEIWSDVIGAGKK